MPRPSVSRRSFGSEDRWAVLLVVVFTILCLGVGLRTGQTTRDVDEVVYQQALVSMQSGQSYYDAMRDALAAKEGAAPSQLRSVRPPTMFLGLEPFPEGVWRWLTALVQGAVLLLAWRIGRTRWPLGGPLAVVAVGFWAIGASPMLYLHAELWGLPLAMAGVLAMRRERWAWAAIAFGGATCVRELYFAFLVVGLALVPRQRWVWAASLAAVVGLIAVHWTLASAVLDPHGREAPFGEDRGLKTALSSLSPADRPFAWLVGFAGTVIGLWVLWRLARASAGRPEQIVGVVSIGLMALTLVFGRTYWGLTFGPILVCYAVMAPTCVRRPPVWARVGALTPG